MKILDAPSEQLNIDPHLIQSGKLLSLDDEYSECIEEYSRVINSDDVKHVEDLRIGNDNYVGMEVEIRRGDECELERVIVKRRRTDIDGNQIGSYHNNPIMDTSQYEVEYLNGELGILTANIIAENLLAKLMKKGLGRCLLTRFRTI